LFPVDKGRVKREVEKLGSSKKTTKGLKVSLVAESYKKTIWNLMDKLKRQMPIPWLNGWFM
jgi:hypothetical protein